MTLISTKDSLKTKLGTTNTLLILFGDDEVTRAVHDKIKQMKSAGAFRPGQVGLRVADLSLLTPTQKQKWAAAEGKYVVSKPDASAERKAVLKGSVKGLLTDHKPPRKKRPSAMKIQTAIRGVKPA